MKILLLLGLLFTHAWAESLSELIPYPYYAVHNKSENKVMFIEDGMSALTLRVDMIRKAQKSIEMEYFIFDLDTSGKIITKELVQAAKRGVKVRLLIDKSRPIFEFDESYAQEVAKFGVSVRFYNAAKLWRISSIQFRNHRKLLVIDDQEALTGGRNIGDDYFDLSTKFNFDDADIHVQGPMVRIMRESFDRYFDHSISERPKAPKKPNPAVAAFFEESDEESRARDRLEGIGRKILSATKVHTCPTLTFSSDGPGANFKRRIKKGFVDKHRFLRKTLFDKITTVDGKLTLSSPYMIDSEETNAMLKVLQNKGVEIELYSNSLGSTDAAYVAANMYMGLKKWRRQGIKVYLHDGKWIPKNLETPEEVRLAKTGTHSKVHIYDSKSSSEVMVGTYNIDNRSNYYNTEMAIFCQGNPELTEEIRRSIEVNKKYALVVGEDGKSATDRNGESRSVFGANKKELRMMRLLTLPSWLLRFLL